MEERLQKIIARAGIASRRHAEELIASGLVTVNGRMVTEPGTKADPSRDHIKVSGKLVRMDARPVYLLLNKPAEVVATMSDPEGRRSLRDLLQGVQERVFPVGRLEYHATGAMVLTNDGELANAILQSSRMPQSWQFKLQTLLTFEEIAQLARTTGARIARMKGPEAAWYEVTLSESRRDVLRNRLFQTGHPVEKMKRVGIAGIELGRLGPGEHRELSAAEVNSLRRAAAGERIAPREKTRAESRGPYRQRGPRELRAKRGPRRQNPSEGKSRAPGEKGRFDRRPPGRPGRKGPGRRGEGRKERPRPR
ncbi:MAG TPA: S4 domain-containing protein [Verrucomicrobiae bacterium]|nr:S4 domain-containing protein [Verrucomicrobiae bacterium]